MSTLSKVIDQDDMHRITSEFSRLRDRCYLEHAGSALYPKSLLESINDDLMNNVYSNPHTDKYTRDCVDQIRCLILDHFNTDPSTYSVIFTSGTTQSLKLLVESFQFGIDQNEVLNCGSFVYTRDNHTSVLGLREIAAEKNADVIHINHNDFISSLEGNDTAPSKWKEKYKNEGNTLLVYPAQNNFNGFKYPINCMKKIKDGCLNNYIKKQLCKVSCNWYVLLDAASYAASSKLDLSKYQPDFIALSFYKIFGFPTGLGALLVKNDSIDVLNEKRYFGGGTVDIVLSSEDFHVKREALHERFEDGTVPFLSIIALKHCFDVLNKLIPKVMNNDVMETISCHTFHLAKDLYHQLQNLQHRNGKKAAVLYMDSDFTDISKQGATVTFNIKREDGSYIGYAEFQHLADLFSISIRTGCFCNSGSCQRHLNATNKEMKDMYKAGHKCGDEIDLIQGKPTGAVRASFGYHNTFEDVDKLMQMIHQCFLKTKFKPPKRVKVGLEIIKPPENGKIINEKSKLIDDDLFNDIGAPFVKSDITLNEIAIFPVKSCGAFKVKTAWPIGQKGFKYDREWMIVKENGTCLTQKQNTRMCMIKPTIDLKQKLLILNFKGQQPITLPLNPSTNKLKEHFKFCQTKVCTDIVQGYDCGDEVADWISNALEVSFLRLIRQSSNDKRKVKKKGEKEDLLALSNQAQFLLINKATVRWLADKIQDPAFSDSVEQLTDRFRGNLVIDMDEELAERTWQRVIIGKHEFKVEGLCPRCQMVCIDQQTGEKTVEPLRTISEQFGGKLRFGIYLTYVGTIDGSKDNVLKTNTHVQPLSNEDDISRFQEWFYQNFLTNHCYSCQVPYKPSNVKQKIKLFCVR